MLSQLRNVTRLNVSRSDTVTQLSYIGFKLQALTYLLINSLKLKFYLQPFYNKVDSVLYNITGDLISSFLAVFFHLLECYMIYIYI